MLVSTTTTYSLNWYDLRIPFKLEKILVLMSRLPEDSEFAQRLEVLVIDIRE